ncbi:hypothetical protein GSU75_01832 [Pseudomonas savastanoi pv. phaseolicola]|uniref:hypothetical protein n=1 Tax=Pseudomonas syringae group TaxID=136849 RepID=UPI0006B9A8F5|nr:hypothetical protein [Pseudomonas savastanoi]MBN4174623.1 hypothetical protein [Pseudomonas savastanoi pv. phaseolicola]
MIDQDGYLTFPLYHGTSTLYRDSIKKHGLGALRDTSLFDFGLLEQFAELLDAPRNKTDWWQMNDFVVKAMIKQGISGGGFNFRYGGLYLSSSRQTAQMYARSPKGSELISHIFLAYEALKSVNPKEARRLLPCKHPLTELFEQPSRPMLITINRIKAHELTTEHGNPIEQQLAEMKAVREEAEAHLIDASWQQRNFAFAGTLEPQKLTFEEL